MERYINIVDHYQRVNNQQVFYDKQAKLKKCLLPWQNLVINQHGNTYICASPAWLPKSIGSLLDYSDFFDLLNTHEARSIRSEIESGRYMYCNQSICSHLSPVERHKFYNTVPTPGDRLLAEEEFTVNSVTHQLPTEICFDFDFTCNFQCPSCRTEMINHNQGPMAEINQRLVEKIKQLILDLYIKNSTPLTLRWAGGEPFLSHAYLDLWDYISQQPNRITNVIQTNGSYLIRRQELLEKFISKISEFRISFDAGTKDTYSKIRVNGLWDTLLENCRYVHKLKTQSGADCHLISDFVTQIDNYQEIPKYVEQADQLGFDTIWIGRMWNWNTWNNSEFDQRNVSHVAHPDYDKFIKILDQVKNHPKVKHDF